MNAFCGRTELPAGNFIVAFFNADGMIRRVISLAKINRMIKIAGREAKGQSPYVVATARDTGARRGSFPGTPPRL